MNFLELFNEVTKLAKPAVAADLKPVTDMQASFKDSNIDSLDLLMIIVFMCEIYGISEDVGKDLKPACAADILAFIEQHKTKEPASVQEAIESVS